LCFYRRDRKTLDIIRWGEEYEYGTVVVDRNRMITLMVEQLRDPGRIRLNGTKEEWADFADQFGTLYRERIASKETREKDHKELYGAEYVWKRSGPDHFAHALLYTLVGLQKFGDTLAKVVGDSVWGNIPKGRIVDAPLAESPIVGVVTPEMIQRDRANL